MKQGEEQNGSRGGECLTLILSHPDYYSIHRPIITNSTFLTWNVTGGIMRNSASNKRFNRPPRVFAWKICRHHVLLAILVMGDAHPLSDNQIQQFVLRQSDW
jgi:hypothetical protein